MRMSRLIAAVSALFTLGAAGWVASAQAAYPLAQNGRIAFDREVGGKRHVFVMNADGTGAQDLSPGGTEGDLQPQFSPDGRWIAFTRQMDSTGGIVHVWLMRPDGSGAVDITPG